MTINYDEQYYVIMRENNDYYPTMWGDLKPKSKGIKIKEDENCDVNIYLDLSNGVQDKFVDYHSSAGDSVTSERFYEFIEKLNIKGVQFLKGTKGNVIEELKLIYYVMHIYNRIACIDRLKSIIEIDKKGGYISDIEKFSIDHKVFDKIPLEDRLIFFLDESVNIKIFHESIVKEIKKMDMKGVRFIKVSDWDDNVAFS